MRVKIRLKVSLLCLLLTIAVVSPASGLERRLTLDVVEVTWPGAPSPTATIGEVANSIK